MPSEVPQYSVKIAAACFLVPLSAKLSYSRPIESAFSDSAGFLAATSRCPSSKADP